MFECLCVAVWTSMLSGYIVLLFERRVAISYELLLQDI